LNEADAGELYEMISRHHAFTNSLVARFVLDDFEYQVQHFIKVYPKDYKRVLEAAGSLKTVRAENK
jgi:glutamate synthase (NADPH/NADH) large chain